MRVFKRTHGDFFLTQLTFVFRKEKQKQKQNGSEKNDYDAATGLSNNMYALL